ncbi:lipid-binding SYLF domain-containing protein [Massilia horti]|uniref:Ysc84 actin-binding domain-containing protein n=1 Tax=Massilia horti TaxID=2562153 RepID=A0A4Y9SXN8_9BURK|nr:lipid-binding SYLF domain-containing protein [Massilia horti]TFW31186.1 hypothetical protein E4O92_14380 [Massilia horti]
MLKMLARPAGLLLTCVYLLLAGCASPKTQVDAATDAENAQATLERFVRDPQMTWLQQNLPRAKAVLVSPSIWQAGFIVGASGGTATVMARSQGPHRWVGPAFYKLGTGSIGLQAGAQNVEMVILVMNDKAFNSLLSNSFKLGADVSIAVGPVGAGTGAPIVADMVIYTRSRGLYGGINLSGMVVTVDSTGNASYYGQPASPVDILVRQTVTSPRAAALEQRMVGLEAEAANSVANRR